MSRKETESEKETDIKWQKVKTTKDAYNDSILPADAVRPDADPAIPDPSKRTNRPPFGK